VTRTPGLRVKPAMTGLLLALGALSSHALPSFEQTRSSHQPSDTLLLDRHGEVVHRLRSDNSVRRGQWVRLADMSPALRTAMVASEDKNFYEHSGVDWRAVSSAAWGNLWNSRTRGASTISMQLVGLLEADWRQGPGGRSVTQKIGQTVAAQVLDRRWRKDQILEAYLNLVPFRGELVGVDALSRTLFGKAANGLDEQEAAVAAALVRAPNASARAVAQRACGVLKAMQPPGNRTDCEALDVFAASALQRKAFDSNQGIAPHLARRLAAGDPDSRSIRSTLRADLQRVALQTLQRQLRELRTRNVEDGAVVVLDNASGGVLAWVGSSGELSDAAEVDGVTALRQPGSTLKPFLYAQAIAERRLTAASLLEDAPTHIPTAGGLYIPQNYDHQFKGWVSVRTALGASLNVPAVRTLVMVSPDAFQRQLRAVGLPLKESGDYYGYSLALGSAEVPLLALANAYRTLANGGRSSPVAFKPGAKPAFTQAIDSAAAFIVGDSLLATRFWTAVKTGTSKDMRDNWALGWSQRYTVGVWVGNASGAPMHDVSGTSGAAPVWATVMQYLHAREPSRRPMVPTGVSESRVTFGGALEAARPELFLRGTEQQQVAIDSIATRARPERAAALFISQNRDTGGARITSPPAGTIVALDPDIPPQRQRLRFTAEGVGLHWRMDGKEFARGGDVKWPPWPGRHRVQLAGAHGELLDEIRIEVRGAGVRGNARGPTP
jgi:penicillin-binding protein 1C